MALCASDPGAGHGEARGSPRAYYLACLQKQKAKNQKNANSELQAPERATVKKKKKKKYMAPVL